MLCTHEGIQEAHLGTVLLLAQLVLFKSVRVMPSETQRTRLLLLMMYLRGLLSDLLECRELGETLNS